MGVISCSCKDLNPTASKELKRKWKAKFFHFFLLVNKN